MARAGPFTAERMATVDVSRLATWLSYPSLIAEFGPESPWSDASAVDTPAAEPWPEPDRYISDLRQSFDESVATCIGQHEVVAVALSGGLDSLAVLQSCSKRAKKDGRRLVAVVAEMIDDSGTTNAVGAWRLVRDLGINCTFLIARRETSPVGSPEWSARGPRLDALPKVNRLLAELGERAGATVLLTGSGADELLGAVPYLLPRRTVMPTLRRFSYLRDTVVTGRRAFVLEMASIGARALPAYPRAIAYFAASWPELSRFDVPEVLGARYSEPVREWTRRWVKNTIRFHAAHHSDWATMEAWDAVYPLHHLDSPGPLPLLTPFLEPAFMAIARRLPLESRYDPVHDHAYWRQKAQVLKLLPSATRLVLPQAKATYRHELGRSAMPQDLRSMIVCQLGLVRPEILRKANDPTTRHRVLAIETWLVGALAYGHDVNSA
ncbi:MAG: hypothetical protein E6J20_00170 [Chloroflexi bacterium]|nr:MAG: hypothetical protein E6J20_00170 [Chloroflexota bacterium]